MNCPNCGRRVPDNQDRCVYCGARINTGNRRPIIDSGRTSGPNYIPVIIFLVAVIIALVLLFIIQFRGKSSSQTDSTGTQAASQNNPDPSAGSQSKASDMKAVDTITDETSVGDIVYFGRYEQDNQLDNGSEPIEWIVLDKVDDEFLLITSDIIDEVCYNDVWEETTWADCSLRDWLNGKFLYDAFTDEQRSSIISTTNWNSSGDDTTDKVFILNEEELRDYFDNMDDRSAGATPYAEARGVYVYENGNSWWWVRDAGSDPHYAVYVNCIGDILDYGILVFNNTFGVRPAIWVEK